MQSGPETERVVLRIRIEGSEEEWLIRANLVRANGSPVAVLRYGPDNGLSGGVLCGLQTNLLSPSTECPGEFHYYGDPVRFPRDVVAGEMKGQPTQGFERLRVERVIQR